MWKKINTNVGSMPRRHTDTLQKNKHSSGTQNKTKSVKIERKKTGRFWFVKKPEHPFDCSENSLRKKNENEKMHIAQRCCNPFTLTDFERIACRWISAIHFAARKYGGPRPSTTSSTLMAAGPLAFAISPHLGDREMWFFGGGGWTSGINKVRENKAR